VKTETRAVWGGKKGGIPWKTHNKARGRKEDQGGLLKNTKFGEIWTKVRDEEKETFKLCKGVVAMKGKGRRAG